VATSSGVSVRAGVPARKSEARVLSSPAPPKKAAILLPTPDIFTTGRVADPRLEATDNARTPLGKTPDWKPAAEEVMARNNMARKAAGGHNDVEVDIIVAIKGFRWRP
jgi:hypothetical protein